MTVAKGDSTPDTGHMPPRIVLPPKVIAALKDAGATEIDSGDTRESGFTTPHLSFSQMSMYLRCSMQYWFRYVQHLKDKPKVSLAIGLGGHAALEKNAKRKLKTGSDAPVEELLDWASDFMDNELSRMPASEIEKDVEPGATKDKFIAATKIFRIRDAPKIIPVGVETTFTLDLNEFDPMPLEDPIRLIKGKIDIISEDTETFMTPYNDVIKIGVDDYKFVTRKRSQNEVNLSPQLTLYAAVIKKLTNKWPTKLGYKQFHPGTTKDAPDMLPLLREPALMTPTALEARMRRIVYQMRKVEEGIRAGIFIPTDDPITCSWCGFRERCQASLVDDFEAATIRETTKPPE